MVTRSISQPAWLTGPAPESDVVLSSRVRLARNLRGFNFPHHASADDLRQVLARVEEAIAALHLPMETVRTASMTERNFLVTARIISPDFELGSPGRALLLDEDRLTSVLINEEDHLRIQAVTAGSNLPVARHAALYLADRLARHLDFASTPESGYLTASPFNAGVAMRHSVLVHLIGLGYQGSLRPWLKRIREAHLMLRGLYGEPSRATGAIFQLSTIRDEDASFHRLFADIVDAERECRHRVSTDELAKLVASAIEFATTRRSLRQSDALRVLSWARWGADRGLPGLPSHRIVDERIATLEASPLVQDQRGDRWRADVLRKFFST